MEHFHDTIMVPFVALHLYVFVVWKR